MAWRCSGRSSKGLTAATLYAMQMEIAEFYAWVVHTRKVLFHFLRGVPEDVYRSSQVGGKTLLQQHKHVAEVYHWWTGTILLGRPWTPLNAENLAQIEFAFSEVDVLVEQALSTEDLPPTVARSNEQGVTEYFDQRWLVLHPITHEFHHKGQLVMMARLLGFIFPEGQDSDLQFIGTPR